MVSLVTRFPMFKPSILCRLSICRRLTIILVIWTAFLLGATEIRRAAQGSSTVYEGLKRLAVYSIAMKASQ